MEVTGLTADSRQVTPGMAFVAVEGPEHDGHRYIGSAISAGAGVIVARDTDFDAPAGVVKVQVADSAVALGTLASEWYGNPSRKLTLVGVTGTNGKTTVATLLYEMARLQGFKAGLLSTVCNKVDDRTFGTRNTTPSPLEINRLLAMMVDRGCTFAAMEVSSHGQVQRRTAGLHFAGGIFTNLTRDHLDYHKTFKAYLDAKKSFFDALPPTAWALTNADDANGAVMVQSTMARRLTYTVRGAAADYRCRILADGIEGMELELNGTEVNTVFAGRFNASNLTAVYGAWCALGHDPEQTALHLSALRPVCGRFETMRGADGVTAVIDYAHTPDALENVLGTIRNSRPAGKVWVVFGAGGDRDHGKRPRMGRIAAALADIVTVTDDNPRTEDPAAITADILRGIDPADMPRVTVCHDRTTAISRAILQATPGDVVLVAGKGHEDYQIVGTAKLHLDDHEAVRDALAQRLKHNA